MKRDNDKDKRDNAWSINDGTEIQRLTHIGGRDGTDETELAALGFDGCCNTHNKRRSRWTDSSACKSNLLVKFIKHNQKLLPKTYRFDLCQRPSSEETGTQSQVTVIDREPERFTRWIKEAVHNRKEGQQAMNRDEGSYQLSHAYDRFLDMASSHRVNNRKNWVPASSDEGLWHRSKSQVLGNNFGGLSWI